ncbi:toxic anion resistance protein [Kaarinaea lacus]
MTTQAQGEHLVAADPVQLKDELSSVLEKEISAKIEDDAINQQARAAADKLFSIDQLDVKNLQSHKAAVETLGLDLQKESARKSDMLKQPISKLSQRGEDGGEVANALVDLKLKVEELDPAQFDFSPGWFSRSLGFLPFVGNPIKRYFTRYESADTVLSAIKNSLEKGQRTLERDNVTLIDDQHAMRELTFKLENAIKIGQAIDEELVYRMENKLSPSDEKYKFIEEEILFPLRQRIQDLQQQLIVNQQGFLAIEMIIRNNKELVRGVTRALNVTMSALQVAATLALALANQRIVLEKVESINETTNSLIAGTAKRLKEQGAAIHKQAASTQLDMNVLKQSFTDIRSALDDIAKFRHDALPKMAQTIIELNGMTEEQDKAIQDLEKGNRVAAAFQIEV